LHQRRFELAEKDDERGMTLDDCFVAVSELLSEINSEAAGGAETMRRSYRLIEAAGGAHATAETFKRARRFFK
jgi:hypothetical protein